MVTPLLILGGETVEGDATQVVTSLIKVEFIKQHLKTVKGHHATLPSHKVHSLHNQLAVNPTLHHFPQGAGGIELHINGTTQTLQAQHVGKQRLQVAEGEILKVRRQTIAVLLLVE